jgi:hypothetical protein
MTTQLLNHASTPVVDGNLTPLGYEKVTGLSAVKTLTPPAGARLALIQAESQNCRWRDDGTNPSATDGMILKTTADLWYIGTLSALRFLELAASATIHVSYYR